MNGNGHYREAERLLAVADAYDEDGAWATATARRAEAQVRATLALAAAIDRHSTPAPTAGPDAAADHLRDIADVLFESGPDGPARMRSDEVRQRLAARNPAEYRAWTASDLKQVLEPHGAAPRKSRGVMVVDRDRVLTALRDRDGQPQDLVRQDALAVLREMHTDRLHTADLLAGLIRLNSARYGDFTPERLAAELKAAGVRRTVRQISIGGINRSGYHLADLDPDGPRARPGRRHLKAPF
ncbi:hypothetical protein ACH4FX_06900 [Streptomyces sp. NPDC018019]|uniref:hypothetical protein n=1 Tax=Streptomyces sp. NPDC018019 TaxID=3365030 RepID=UPI0037A82BCB